MKAMITTVVSTLLMIVTASAASADTFEFPLDARKGGWQVDVAMTVYMPPNCAGRWSVGFPAGFTFSKGGLNGGNLRGNPGKGSYDVSVNVEACPMLNSDYVMPAKTYWHKVIVD